MLEHRIGKAANVYRQGHIFPFRLKEKQNATKRKTPINQP